jgi:hypothetical protein
MAPETSRALQRSPTCAFWCCCVAVAMAPETSRALQLLGANATGLSRLDVAMAPETSRALQHFTVASDGKISPVAMAPETSRALQLTRIWCTCVILLRVAMALWPVPTRVMSVTLLLLSLEFSHRLLNLSPGLTFPAIFCHILTQKKWLDPLISSHFLSFSLISRANAFIFAICSLDRSLVSMVTFLARSENSEYCLSSSSEKPE